MTRRTTPPTRRALAGAVIARFDGIWDDPALTAWGPLGDTSASDVYDMARAVLEEPESPEQINPEVDWALERLSGDGLTPNPDRDRIRALIVALRRMAYARLLDDGVEDARARLAARPHVGHGESVRAFHDHQARRPECPDGHGCRGEDVRAPEPITSTNPSTVDAMLDARSDSGELPHPAADVVVTPPLKELIIAPGSEIARHLEMGRTVSVSLTGPRPDAITELRDLADRLERERAGV